MKLRKGSSLFLNTSYFGISTSDRHVIAPSPALYQKMFTPNTGGHRNFQKRPSILQILNCKSLPCQWESVFRRFLIHHSWAHSFIVIFSWQMCCNIHMHAIFQNPVWTVQIRVSYGCAQLERRSTLNLDIRFPTPSEINQHSMRADIISSGEAS